MSNRLLREIQGLLLARGRGTTRTRALRRTQNWIFGNRPGNAVFVPPPPQVVADSMSDLERFLHAETHRLPTATRAGRPWPTCNSSRFTPS